MRLRAWQLEVERYLLGADAQPSEALRRSLLGSAALDAEHGLAIYHNAYRARLLEALRGDYAALHGWLGDEQFERLARDYLDAHPSRHYSLRWLGADFAAFIEAHLVPEQAAALAELARLEWAFTLAFDAPDAQPLRLEQVQALAPQAVPELRVALLPSVQWLVQRHNSLALWRALKEGEAFPGSQLLAVEESCLVWRDDLVTRYRSLAADEARALDLLARQGLSFAELCAAIAGLGEQAPQVAAGWLRQWLGDGILCRAQRAPTAIESIG